MLTEVWPFVARNRAAGVPVILARLVDRDGPGSRPLGATMAVAADGTWRGSLSGGCVEGIVRDEALSLLDSGGSRLISVSPGDHLMPWEDAPACGGVLHVLLTPAPPEPVFSAIDAALKADQVIAVGVELAAPWGWRTAGTLSEAAGRSPEGAVFAEELRPGPRLIVVGATDLATALAALGRTVGRRVEIVDPRPSHTQADMFPGATLVSRSWPDAWLAAHPPSPGDAVLAIAHDPRIDDRALRVALPGPAGYVGVLGSRPTHERRLERLAGTPGLERLSGPAGLDLGGSSVAETALSILAEVVASAHARSGGRISEASSPIRAAAATSGGPATGPRVSGGEEVPLACAL
ncbi:XdhC family protein [Catenuloplanes sp. NPDC051500]|uniref:XdhC family protein n=1 Tax=Catenuloplanes sp. NPDC051500 TaxID=3363959 RepID=UPI0037A713AD